MAVSWEMIQQALGAGIRGEDPKPVVSQRTLFGIPSSVEVRMAEIAQETTQAKARERKQQENQQNE